jgi:Family of unknown function (DUF6114)
MNAQKMAEAFPSTASILAIVGACFMIVAGLLVLAASAFIIPHLNSSFFNGTMNFNNTGHQIPIHNLPGFVGGILAGVGLFGLISGLVVLGSGIMARIHPEQSTVFGVLILVFSVLSFFGSGGFVIGALLGIIGGVMMLRWRRPATAAEAPTSVPVA